MHVLDGQLLEAVEAAAGQGSPGRIEGAGGGGGIQKPIFFLAAGESGMYGDRFLLYLALVFIYTMFFYSPSLRPALLLSGKEDAIALHENLNLTRN